MNTIETGPSDNVRDFEVWSRSWTHFRVDRRSPRYCHETFDHPPINHDNGHDRRRDQRPRRPHYRAMRTRASSMGPGKKTSTWVRRKTRD